VNLFIVGWSPSGAADEVKARTALGGLLARLPFFGAERIESWQASGGNATVAYVSHEEERVGGVRYVDHDEQGIGLFSGRPFRWTGDGEADGRGPLDPRLYRQPAGEWLQDLDGRFAVVRYDDRERELEVYADPLGAYPIFSGEAGRTRWISNSAELVRTALGTDELDLSVVASVLGAGHCISGDPVWARVKRLPGGVVAHLRAGRPDSQSELLPLDQIAAQTGHGFEPVGAARDLVAATRALADWPGRPTLLQLSGGRDSRLVLAAALAAGVEFDAVSAGTSETPDVLVARLLCERTGIRHRLLPRDPGGVLHQRTREVAHIVGITTAGTFSIEHAAGYPIAQSAGPLPLWVGGQGGEIARAYYGTREGGEREALVRQLFIAIAGSAEILSATGKERLRREVASAVDRQVDAGVALDDVFDLFYLRNRMGIWSASGFGCVEYGKGDSVPPLWSRRMLDHELGPEPAERVRERFHAATLEVLSPELARVPLAEASNSTSAEFVPIFEQVQAAVATQPTHPAWEVLERAYVEQLLTRDPMSLNPLEYRHVWRLATVFMNSEHEDCA
jgi:hypothetical protein